MTKEEIHNEKAEREWKEWSKQCVIALYHILIHCEGVKLPFTATEIIKMQEQLEESGLIPDDVANDHSNKGTVAEAEAFKFFLDRSFEQLKSATLECGMIISG